MLKQLLYGLMRNIGVALLTLGLAIGIGGCGSDNQSADSSQVQSQKALKSGFN